MKLVRTTTYAEPEHYSETALVDAPAFVDREDFLDAAFGAGWDISAPDDFRGGQDVGFTFVGVFQGVPRVLEFEWRAEGFDKFLGEFNRFAERVDLATLPSDYRQSDMPQIDVLYETERAHAARLAEEAADRRMRALDESQRRERPEH